MFVRSGTITEQNTFTDFLSVTLIKFCQFLRAAAQPDNYDPGDKKSPGGLYMTGPAFIAAMPDLQSIAMTYQNRLFEISARR